MIFYGRQAFSRALRERGYALASVATGDTMKLR